MGKNKYKNNYNNYIGYNDTINWNIYCSKGYKWKQELCSRKNF